MQKIEKCLDLILQSLIDNGDSLCIYEVDNMEGFQAGNFIPSPPYNKLFSSLALSNDEAKQLLEILKSQEYLDYTTVSGMSGGSMLVKFKATNTIGNTVNINNKMNEWIGKPDKLIITLKGKFFILEGGYTSKLSRIDKLEKNQLHMQKGLTYATIVLALGTLGLLVMEVLRFLAGH